MHVRRVWTIATNVTRTQRARYVAISTICSLAVVSNLAQQILPHMAPEIFTENVLHKPHFPLLQLHPSRLRPSLLSLHASVSKTTAINAFRPQSVRFAGTSTIFTMVAV